MLRFSGGATGSVDMNARRLVDHLHAIAYHRAVSARRLREGDVTELLPVLHFVLLDYSPHVAAFVAAKGFALYAQDDASFVDAVFRLSGLHLGLRPSLQARQFLARGFAGGEGGVCGGGECVGFPAPRWQ